MAKTNKYTVEYVVQGMSKIIKEWKDLVSKKTEKEAREALTLFSTYNGYKLRISMRETSILITDTLIEP